MPIAVARLSLIDSDVGVIAPVKGGRFRFFVDGANLEVTNLSSGFRKGPTQATLTGRFLGSGTAHGSATFRDDAPRPGLQPPPRRRQGEPADDQRPPALLRQVRRRGGDLLRLLRGQGPRTAASTATSSRCSQDLQVYDPKQDKDKPVLKKLYEKVVGGVAHVLENHATSRSPPSPTSPAPLGAQHQHLGDRQQPGLERLRQGDPARVRAGVQGRERQQAEVPDARW